MRFLALLPLLAMLLNCSLRAEDAATPKPDQLAQWVKELGHENYAKRVEAEAALAKAGDAAKAELEKASGSDDPETKTRSTRLLGVLKTEPILKKMEAAITEAKSVAGEMKMLMGMMGQLTEMKATFKSAADGKRFIMDMTIAIGGQEIPSHVVSDGTTMWSELTLPGGQGKMVQKFSMATMEKMGGGSQNPIHAVKDLRERFVFTNAKEDKLGEVEVYVLEGKLREGLIDKQAKVAEEVGGPMAAQMARAQLEQMDVSRLYIGKKDLLFRKSEVLDRDGKVMIGVELSKMEQGVKIDDAEFKYTPPAGAQIMDMEEQFKLAREAGAGGMAPGPEAPKEKIPAE